MLRIENEPTRLRTLHPDGQTRIKSAAALVGVHHQTLRRWWKAGKFPQPLNIHGILLFKNADLLAWLDSNTQKQEN